jgi:acetylornithine deacetylase/succinyl-diaminopimelate desuccinylase-like protein
MLRPALGLAVLALVAGCTVDPPPVQPENSSVAPTLPAATATPTISPASPQPRQSATSTPRRPREPTMDAGAALRDVRTLATDIGPREATSDNFAEAADLVEARFDRLGYDVRRTTVRVPAGNSWGTPVRGGRSANVIAEPPAFDSRKPHVVVGAHLDTVPTAPGAEDNASGIAVMLQLARMVAQQPAELPVQFIAFGAEEPRGSGDALHHFGSRQLVAGMTRPERRAVRAMVSLDRVGVRASYVPVCSADESGDQLRASIRAAARRADITTRSCLNRASDHWSYAKAGIPAVRLGSVPYAGYHSAGDVPSVVDRRQLDRVGRVMWAWLRSVE